MSFMMLVTTVALGSLFYNVRDQRIENESRQVETTAETNPVTTFPTNTPVVSTPTPASTPSAKTTSSAPILLPSTPVIEPLPTPRSTTLIPFNNNVLPPPECKRIFIDGPTSFYEC